MSRIQRCLWEIDFYLFPSIYCVCSTTVGGLGWTFRLGRSWGLPNVFRYACGWPVWRFLRCSWGARIFRTWVVRRLRFLADWSKAIWGHRAPWVSFFLIRQKPNNLQCYFKYPPGAIVSALRSADSGLYLVPLAPGCGKFSAIGCRGKKWLLVPSRSKSEDTYIESVRERQGVVLAFLEDVEIDVFEEDVLVNWITEAPVLDGEVGSLGVKEEGRPFWVSRFNLQYDFVVVAGFVGVYVSGIEFRFHDDNIIVYYQSSSKPFSMWLESSWLMKGRTDFWNET